MNKTLLDTDIPLLNLACKWELRWLESSQIAHMNTLISLQLSVSAT